MVHDRPTCILLVANDSAKRRELSKILRAEGFVVQEAAAGDEGLRLAADQRPDLILVYGHLADRSGIVVCRQFTADPRTAASLVLYVTAQEALDRPNGLAEDFGADSYLSEPIDPPVLLAHIHALLRLRQA